MQEEDVTWSRMINSDNCFKFIGRIKGMLMTLFLENSTHLYDSSRVGVDFNHRIPFTTCLFYY